MMHVNPNQSRQLLLVTLLLAFMAACGSSGGGEQADADASTGSTTEGATRDASEAPDTTWPDTRQPDTARPDTRQPDLPEDTTAEDAAPEDAAPDSDPVEEDTAAPDTAPDEPDSPPPVDECAPGVPEVPQGCMGPLDEAAEGLCNGLDDDCDRQIDEGCPCEEGESRSCFPGAPGRAETGACMPGSMTCVAAEEGDGAAWGECVEASLPQRERCDGLDNDCDGCADEGCAPTGRCPDFNDPRTPNGAPFVDYPLRGELFFEPDEVESWSWGIEGGICDQILPRPSYALTGADTQDAVFRPSLSGRYEVKLRVVKRDGTTSECSWTINVLAPGLRVEMCYPESTTVDLDLYMMPVSRAGDWFFGNNVFSPNTDACSWYNCEAYLRGAQARVDWGLASSDLAACEGTPLGDRWRQVGYCVNPRLDIDNNLSEGIGVPENINIDAPASGEGYRIMVQNFSGRPARPVVNVYCGGQLKASVGAPPEIVPDFTGLSGSIGFGAMWRVMDVFVVSSAGEITDCRIEAVHPPGAQEGFHVTQEDPSF